MWPFSGTGGYPDLSLKIYEASYKGNSVFFRSNDIYTVIVWIGLLNDQMKDQIHGLPQEDEASLQRQLGGKKEEHL